MSILQTIDLKKYYGTEPNITRALNGVNFTVKQCRLTAAGSSNYGNKFSLFHSKIYTIKGTSDVWFCAVILL